MQNCRSSAKIIGNGILAVIGNSILTATGNSILTAIGNGILAGSRFLCYYGSRVSLKTLQELNKKLHKEGEIRYASLKEELIVLKKPRGNSQAAAQVAQSSQSWQSPSIPCP